MKKLLLVMCSLLCVTSMEAKNDKDKDRGGDRDDDRGRKEDRDDDRGGRVYFQFRSADRRAIYDYYRVQPSGLPPGLAKRNGDLPPGLQKQLRRNGRLPPGLEKKLVPFPADLDRRLPPLPAGVWRGVLGDRAVIYDTRTMAILDVLAIIR